MNKKLLVMLVLVLVVTTVCMVACKKKPIDKDKVEVEQITLDKSEIVAIKGAQITLVATVSPTNATDTTVMWKSSDESIATVDNAGKVNVLGTGIATITVTTAKGDMPAAARIYSGDKVVDKAYAGTAPNYYTTIAAAMEAGNEVGTIIVLEGNYDEAITTTKSATLIGKGNVVLQSFNSSGTTCATVLENITFSVSSYPATATVKQDGGSLKMKTCKLLVTSEDEKQGGYAIMADKCSSLTLEDNEISGYRYGIYITANNTTVSVKNNKLKKLDVGIGVDVRNVSGTENSTAKGEISTNSFEETEKDTEFYYNGEEYDGELVFTDHKTEAEPQQPENPNPPETPDPNENTDPSQNPDPSIAESEEG